MIYFFKNRYPRWDDMLHLYLFWAYMALILYICGFSGKRFVETVTRQKITQCTPVDLIWVGAALLTAACMWISLVHRIDTTVHRAGVLVIFVYALMDRKQIGRSVMDWAGKFRRPADRAR